MRRTGGFWDSVGCLWLLGGRPLVFLLYMACPCLCNDDIESEHADNRRTRGGVEREHVKVLHNLIALHIHLLLT